MPKDGKGKFHMNTQRAMASDRMGKSAGGGGTDHGDWSKNPPEENQDGGGPDQEIGAHLTNMQAKHGGQHMHVHEHEDGSGHTTHHIGHDGEVQGPHHHPDAAALHGHIDGVMGGHGGGAAQHEKMGGGQPAGLGGY